jgi:hypothetical protein
MQEVAMENKTQSSSVAKWGLIVAIIACVAAWLALIPEEKRWPFSSEETSTPECPSTRDEIADLIGGEPEHWTPPDWTEGAWVYRNKGQFIPLHYPGIGRLDVWINRTVEITKDNAYLLDRNQFDEASFHCFVD